MQAHALVVSTTSHPSNYKLKINLLITYLANTYPSLWINECVALNVQPWHALDKRIAQDILGCLQ
jgi:hypothetical protein